MTSLRILACAIALAVASFIGSTGAHAQGAPLFAVLNGGNECTTAAAPVCRKGDLDAFGSATIIFPTATSLCFAILVDNIAGPNAAHIHRGVSGVNGAIVVNLAPPVAPGGGNPGGVTGCVAVAAALVTQLRTDPSQFYINVHSGGFPSGAVRGQLF